MKLTTFTQIMMAFFLLAHASLSVAGEQTEKGGIDGRMLQSLCADYLKASTTGDLQKESSKPYMRCEHYIQGLVDASVFYERMMYTVSGNHLFCFPKKVISTRQAILVTNEYLKKHPEKLNSRGLILVMESFLDAYPCKK